MSEEVFHHYLLITWFILAGVIFITLFFIVAPYGRHIEKRRWFSIDSTTGWIIMESTAPLVFAALFWFSPYRNAVPELIFLGLWEAHYIHRAFIYPIERRDAGKRIPLTIVVLGLVFNGVNAYLNGRYLFTFSGGYSMSWLTDPRFAAGVCVFIAGYLINRRSDLILRSLRQPGESGYQVANQGFYRWISCPNYLGEILIWIGWAIATWSWTGLSFAFWTAANLVPRAHAHHQWYRRNFPDYPANRRALIPGIW